MIIIIYKTHGSAQSKDGVGNIGHVLLLEEVVGLKDVHLFNTVFHNCFLEAENNTIYVTDSFTNESQAE